MKKIAALVETTPDRVPTAGAPQQILGPLDSIFTRALLGGGGGLYIIEIAIAFPSQSFFPFSQIRL